MIITANKDAVKDKILNACIQKQQLLIDDFKGRINALLENDSLGNEEAYDNNELSQTSQKAEEINALHQALAFANSEMKILEGLDPHYEHVAVEPGAMVITNHGVFFISVSAEQIEIEGKTYIGISTQSPLFKSMRSKRKGQRFQCNGRSYQVKDIL